jgi:L-cysteine S-thiosulfotransferase
MAFKSTHLASIIALSLSVWACAISAQTMSAPELGLRIMANRLQGNCVTCHQVSVLLDVKGIEGASGKQGNFGPSLDGVANRYTMTQLRQWVMDARQINPNTRMPPFGSIDGTILASPPRTILSVEEIDQVTAALATLR